VQLDGLISSTIRFKGSLRVNNLQTNTLASCSIQAERGVAKETVFSLQHSTAQIDQLTDCSVDIESGVSKITTSNCIDVSIHLQDYSILTGEGLCRTGRVRVTRMGRHGMNGRILQVKVNSVLVDWGNRTEWLDRDEVYPLDHSGKPRIPGNVSNFSEVAQRARLTLEPEQDSKVLPSESNQLRLF